MVWERQCYEDWVEKGRLIKGVFRTATAKPGVLPICSQCGLKTALAILGLLIWMCVFKL